MNFRPFLCPLAITGLALAILLLPEPWQGLLQYRRDQVLSGELWRLFSGHLTHLNPSHLLMNLAGLWLIWLLFFSRRSFSSGCLYALLPIFLGTALLLLLLSPELAWYRGLSGALHGILALALLRQWHWRSPSAYLLPALFCGKLAWEQFSGPLPGSEGWISGRVIVDSHLYGAIFGSLIWAIERSYRQLKKSEVTG